MKLLPDRATVIALLLLIKNAAAQYYDVVVIGGELAGMTAAYKLKDFDPSIKLLVLEESDRYGGRGAPIVFSGNVMPIHVDNILTELGIGGMTVAVDTIIERMAKSVQVRVNESVINVVVTPHAVLTVTTFGTQFISKYLIISLPSQRANAVNVTYQGIMDAGTHVFFGGVFDTSLTGINFVSDAILAGQSVAELLQAQRERTTTPASSTSVPSISFATGTSIPPNVAKSLERLVTNLINFVAALLRSVKKS